MSEKLTPADVLTALQDIALTIADEYAAKLAALPAEAKTERKALIIQREMATLYIRTVLPGYGKTPTDALLAFMERRLRQVAADRFPAVLAHYEAATEADRRVMLPYLLGWCFEESHFLAPWRAELTEAERYGDVEAAFALKLKIATVTQVLKAGEAFWHRNADRLPAVPPIKEMIHA